MQSQSPNLNLDIHILCNAQTPVQPRLTALGSFGSAARGSSGRHLVRVFRARLRVRALSPPAIDAFAYPRTGSGVLGVSGPYTREEE